MSKHELEETYLPPPKRQHVLSLSHLSSQTHAFDFYDEIILLIFSYLEYKDLCAVQSTNKNWSRLSLDNQLWRRLYLSEYGRARLRGGRGFIGREDGKEVKPLPIRAKEKAPEDLRDWKWMFRISSNWRTGRCSVEQFSRLIPASQINHGPVVSAQVTYKPRRSALLAGKLTIISSECENGFPEILLISQGRMPHNLKCRTLLTTSSTKITALALDQSPPSPNQRTRLVAFLSNGEFICFSLDYEDLDQSSPVVTYSPRVPTQRTAPIIQAVYHHPLIATLSQSFHLSLYDLSSGSVEHTQTLSSFTSHPPSSLVLTPITPSTYKLVLAYAIPVYPAHWSVGATELIISGTMTVASSRTTRTIDVPMGWIDEQKARAIREQWGRKVACVADTQTDGKWVVLAPADLPPSGPFSPYDSDQSSGSIYVSSRIHSPSSLQLYRLYLPASASASSMPKLTFVRTLHGQNGPISSLALADGRCVSLGVNGSIWVWDLEGGGGTEVYEGVQELEIEGSQLSLPVGYLLTQGTVVFDERKLITANHNGVELRRFDI